MPFRNASLKIESAREKALLLGIDVVLPVSLVLMLAFLLWPAMDSKTLLVGIGAALASTALAALILLAGVGARPAADAPPPAIEGFERTHTPAELRAARANARDALTGLPDHVALLAYGAPLLKSEKPRLLAVLEPGGLEEYNLRFGREAGDQALKTVARILTESVGENEIVARCRGSQFAMLLESDSVGDSFRRLRAIQEQLVSHSVASMKVATQTHAGLAWYPRHGLNMTTLLHRARSALDSARYRDRDCVIYSPAIESGLELERDLTSDLALAVENDEIALNYQPLLPLNGQGACGLEVLARWHHPDWGMISPETFISLAEQGGFVSRLTRRVIRNAVEQLAEWRNEGIDTRLSLNLSAHDLFDDTLPGFLSRLCEAAGIEPSLLTLEVTETVMISDAARARLTLKRLRQLGVRVVIDDFGTGYSSLSHLRQLPVDGIKIDKTFVRNLRRGSNDSAIVRVSIELAHSLGLSVTAEGVESEYIETRLEEFQCDVLQGFHICPPLPADAVPGWLIGSEINAGAGRTFQHSLPLVELGA